MQFSNNDIRLFSEAGINVEKRLYKWRGWKIKNKSDRWIYF